MKPFSWIMIFYALVCIASVSMILVGWNQYNQAEILIEWTAASELNTAGYHIYKSSSKDQVGDKITPNIIPVGEDLLAGNKYSYVDTEVLPGNIYYYWLVEIDRLGESHREGPIEVEAKRNPAGLLWMIFGGLLATGAVAAMAWQRQRPRQKIQIDR